MKNDTSLQTIHFKVPRSFLPGCKGQASSPSRVWHGSVARRSNPLLQPTKTTSSKFKEWISYTRNHIIPPEKHILIYVYICVCAPVWTLYIAQYDAKGSGLYPQLYNSFIRFQGGLACEGVPSLYVQVTCSKPWGGSPFAVTCWLLAKSRVFVYRQPVKLETSCLNHDSSLKNWGELNFTLTHVASFLLGCWALPMLHASSYASTKEVNKHTPLCKRCAILWLQATIPPSPLNKSTSPGH